MFANFGNPRSRDRKLRHKKHKKRRFLAWKFINSPLTQKPLGVESWNLYTLAVLRNDLRKPSLEARGHVTEVSLAENHGRWQGGGRGVMAPLDFHSLSINPPKVQKFFHF